MQNTNNRVPVTKDRVVAIPIADFDSTPVFEWCKEHVGVEYIDWKWGFDSYFKFAEFTFYKSTHATLFALRWR
jgi:hypothetical protein